MSCFKSGETGLYQIRRGKNRHVWGNCILGSLKSVVLDLIVLFISSKISERERESISGDVLVLKPQEESKNWSISRRENNRLLFFLWSFPCVPTSLLTSVLFLLNVLRELLANLLDPFPDRHLGQAASFLPRGCLSKTFYYGKIKGDRELSWIMLECLTLPVLFEQLFLFMKQF